MHTEKQNHVTLTFDRWPWNVIEFIKLSAAVHELSTVH